ncbi:MAG: TMEM165/GDT1 family protein [Clostridia bacterium]|nr:TMEM165/GDT1 family protein [Clostridia bacterium]
MTALIGSLFLITMAEMGDKTQLLALAFATRYRATQVLSGIFLATLLVHLVSVVLGEFIGTVIPMVWIEILAGASFIFFGLWTLRGDTLEDEDKRVSKYGPVATVGIAFFLAELGDKTQLATISLAAKYNAFWEVWIGSTLGMVVADGFAIIVGIVLGKRIPEKTIKWVSALIFIGFGVVTLGRIFLK